MPFVCRQTHIFGEFLNIFPDILTYSTFSPLLLFISVFSDICWSIHDCIREITHFSSRYAIFFFFTFFFVFHVKQKNQSKKNNKNKKKKKNVNIFNYGAENEGNHKIELSIRRGRNFSAVLVQSLFSEPQPPCLLVIIYWLEMCAIQPEHICLTQTDRFNMCDYFVQNKTKNRKPNRGPI